jgi:hypothetical protein
MPPLPLIMRSPICGVKQKTQPTLLHDLPCSCKAAPCCPQPFARPPTGCTTALPPPPGWLLMSRVLNVVQRKTQYTNTAAWFATVLLELHHAVSLACRTPQLRNCTGPPSSSLVVAQQQQSALLRTGNKHAQYHRCMVCPSPLDVPCNPWPCRRPPTHSCPLHVYVLSWPCLQRLISGRPSADLCRDVRWRGLTAAAGCRSSDPLGSLELQKMVKDAEQTVYTTLCNYLLEVCGHCLSVCGICLTASIRMPARIPRLPTLAAIQSFVLPRK